MTTPLRRPFPATLLFAAALPLALGGCGSARTTALPCTGTWHLARSAPAAPTELADGDSQGWLAIAPDQVVGDVAGLPRGIAAVVAAQADPARGSAAIDLDNGVRLYLAGGHGAGEYAIPGGRVVGAADWLDVHAVRPTRDGDQEVARLRLWSGESLVTAAKAAQLRRAPLAAAAAPAAAAATTGSAQRVAPVAARTVDAHGTPAPATAMNGARSPAADLRLELLHQLEAARRGEPGALDLAKQTEERLTAAR